MVLIERQQVFVGDVRQRRFAAADRVAVRMIGEQERGAVSRKQPPGVGALCGLQQVDGAIAELRKLRLVECRPQQHVRDEFEHQFGVARQEFGAYRDGFEVSRGVELATECGNGLGELGRVAAAGAFFEHAGQQAGEPVPADGVGDGAAAHDGTQADERNVMLFAEQQNGAVVERNAFVYRQQLAPGVRHRRQDDRHHGEDEQAKVHDDSSATSGERSVPTVMLLRRKTSAATARSCSRVTALILSGCENRFS